MRYAWAALIGLVFASCASERPSLAPAEDQPPRGLRRSQSGLALAVVSREGGDVEAALGSPLAAALDATPLGVLESVRRARVEAHRAEAATLVVCEVLEYSPYDPSRLVVRATVLEVGRTGLSAREVTQLERSPRGPAAAPRTETARSAVVEVDAASERTLNEFAFEDLPRSWGGSHDLLEAEILLRDPARFFPFAARRVAEAMRDARTGL